MTFVPLEKLHRLTEGYRQAFEIGQQRLLLMHCEGRSLLVENACPHAGYPLVQGSVENEVIRCPLHGIAFNLRDGQPLPEFSHACSRALRFYPLVCEGSMIGVLLEKT